MTDEEIQQLLKFPVFSQTLAFVERETVNPQVFLLNLTLEAGISGDVMWSLLTASILCLFRIITDCLWMGLMIAWMRRLTEEHRIDLLPGKTTQKRGMEGQRWTSLSPDQRVASDFGTPQSHAITDESGVISKSWCVQGVLSPRFIS